MMLNHLGVKEASQSIVTAIEQVMSDASFRTPDLGGSADTVTCGKAIADAVLAMP
jgi:tartrate dehydrogenase/decarboxylase/D-malate dehydrogenase